jgi:hypothetical protein
MTGGAKIYTMQETIHTKENAVRETRDAVRTG